MKMVFDKKGGAAGIAFLVILLILLGGAIYLLYLNLPTEPVELKIIDSDSEDEIPVEPEYSASKQFYENMRFPEKEISYRIEPACSPKKIAEVRGALRILESKTVLSFYLDSSGKPDISVLCSEIEPEPEQEGYFVAGEGGPTKVINTSLYSVILEGKASFFREEKCDDPNIAMHEILHVLGFDHNNNPNSILFPTLDCEQRIDQSIINDINALYSVESAADLKIVNVDATKHSGCFPSACLDFEIQVINQGLKDAEDVSLNVYYDGKVIEFESGDFLSLGDIEIGTKKILTVTNAKISRKSEKITFIVDEENKIDEIFENNNQVELVLVED